MSVVNFSLPDREYYAASPVLWDEPTISRPRRRLAPSRLSIIHISEPTRPY